MTASTVDALVPPMVGPGFFREDMPLDELHPSPLNPRKHFPQAGLEELAASIRELGIIEPLVARPVNGHYELVAGERRYRASKLAGLAAVPCTVKHLSEAQALEIMVVENNQREDVNALEEADGFSRLLKSGYEPERLAERLGRSKKYVYDRVKLLDLASPAKQLLLERVISPGHGILLARLKPADQLRALDVDCGGVFESEDGLGEEEEEVLVADQVRADRHDRWRGKAAAGELDEFSVRDVAGMKPKSVRETARWIAEHVRFKPHEMAAAAPLEYGEVERRVLEASARPGRGKKVIPITFEHYIQPEARDEHERTFGPRAFKFADGKPHREYGNYGATPKPTKTCEHSVLGVVVVGEKHGQAFDVCVARDKCQVHWKTEMAERAKNQKLRESGKSGKAEKNEAAADMKYEQRRKQEELERQSQQQAQDMAVNLAADRATEVTTDILRVALFGLLNSDMDHDAFNKHFGTKAQWGGTLKDVKALSGKVLVQAIVFAALSAEVACGDPDGEMFALFKVDVSAIEAKLKADAKKPVQTSAQTKKKSAKKKR